MATRKLRNGQVLSEELIESLAREAEAGYDPATIRPRRVGRPSLGEGTSPRVQYRVDPATYEALLARARAEDRGVSEIARIALERYLRGGQASSADEITRSAEAHSAGATAGAAIVERDTTAPGERSTVAGAPPDTSDAPRDALSPTPRHR